MIIDVIDEFCNADVPYTIDYTAVADVAFKEGRDIESELIERVRYEYKDQFDYEDDIGGVIMFYFDGEIVGFYDYEQFVGRFE